MRLSYRGLRAAQMAALLLIIDLTSVGPAGAVSGRAPAAACKTCAAPQAAPTLERLGHDPALNEEDEIAALEAIRVALSEVGDGVSYVWHRRYGQLAGLVQPTHSFKDAHGRVCRRIIVVLSAGLRSGRIEGTACRLASGRWQLEG
jgi:surface antigen